MRKNFSVLVADLHAHYRSIPKLARVVNVPDSTLEDIKSGRINEPRWSVGDAIIKLHTELFDTEGN